MLVLERAAAILGVEELLKGRGSPAHLVDHLFGPDEILHTAFARPGGKVHDDTVKGRREAGQVVTLLFAPEAELHGRTMIK